jgi:hypothetical protein
LAEIDVRPVRHDTTLRRRPLELVGLTLSWRVYANSNSRGPEFCSARILGRLAPGAAPTFRGTGGRTFAGDALRTHLERAKLPQKKFAKNLEGKDPHHPSLSCLEHLICESEFDRIEYTLYVDLIAPGDVARAM